MTVLVTGAAGFIGFHTTRTLLARGEKVVGIDIVNDYYDVSLKEARLAILSESPNFELFRDDIADKDAVEAMIAKRPDINRVVHLAAQAGVRYSLINPYAYMHSNLNGHVVLVEACRKLAELKHFVYASSSSVYGANTKLPFSIKDRVDDPVSLYAATKKSMEMISESYARMFAIPLTGLRFFTVYGPWGRPDMAYFKFTNKIQQNKEIEIYNFGKHSRSFTYIDDIIKSMLLLIGKNMRTDELSDTHQDKLPDNENYMIYNIGGDRPENLMDYLSEIEKNLNKKAKIKFLTMQAGDVVDTVADTTKLADEIGFVPETNISDGIGKFIQWYQGYYS